MNFHDGRNCLRLIVTFEMVEDIRRFKINDCQFLIISLSVNGEINQYWLCQVSEAVKNSKNHVAAAVKLGHQKVFSVLENRVNQIIPD